MQNLITTVAPSKTSSLPSVPRSTTTTAAPNSVTSSSMSPMEEATEIFMHELLSMNGDKEKMEDQVGYSVFSIEKIFEESGVSHMTSAVRMKFDMHIYH